MKKIITLYPLNQLAIILSEPTGIFYTNQVGGNWCTHPEAEGVLVFVDDNYSGLYHKIASYTIDLMELTKEDADFLDSVFIRKAKYLRVDRTKLEDSMEAWIHVVFVKPEDGFPGHNLLYSGFDSKSGILTWDNSD